MTIPTVPPAAPGQVPGAAASDDTTTPLGDPDVVDEHRTRRSRLDAALRRGTAAPRSTPTWRPAVAGLIIATLGLGGAAVGATVHRYVPTMAFPTPAAKHERHTDAARTPTREDQRDGAPGGSGMAGPATPAAGSGEPTSGWGTTPQARGGVQSPPVSTGAARPYGDWYLDQNWSQTHR